MSEEFENMPEDRQFDATISLFPTNGCVDFSNLGTRHPSLLNGCKDSHTITVKSYRAGRPVGDRVFHLMHGDDRPITFVGDLMVIDLVEGWVNKGGTEGSGSIRLTNRELGGMDLWEARNSDPTHYVAISCSIVQANRKTGTSYCVLSPGSTARMYAFFPEAPGVLLLDWARTDPL